MSTASCPFHALVTTVPSFRSTNSAISIFSSLSSVRRTWSPWIDVSVFSSVSVLSFLSVSIRNGIRITNVVPVPSLLSKEMVPPIFSTSFFVIGIPSPVPANFVRLPACSCANGSKMRFWNASVIPIPVSLQTNSNVVIAVCFDGISRQPI